MLKFLMAVFSAQDPEQAHSTSPAAPAPAGEAKKANSLYSQGNIGRELVIKRLGGYSQVFGHGNFRQFK